MESIEISRIIAIKYHQGRKYKEISEELEAEYGLKLGYDAVKSRVYNMQKNGNIDSLIETDVKIEDNELINEVLGQDGEDLFKIGVYDIETTGFNADFGYILCVVFYDMENKKFDVIRLDESEYYINRIQAENQNAKYWERIDEELVIKTHEIFSKFDLIIHFNGRDFDNKFINTKLTKYQLPLLPMVKQVDMLKIARYRLKLKSKRLDSLKHFFGMDTYEDGHDWTAWQAAANGQKWGFDHVVYHCKRDCVRLAQLAIKMRSHIKWIHSS